MKNVQEKYSMRFRMLYKSIFLGKVNRVSFPKVHRRLTVGFISFYINLANFLSECISPACRLLFVFYESTTCCPHHYQFKRIKT